MSEQEYEILWHYSEQFSRDKIQRSELVTFAFMQEKKLGEKCSIGLQKSIMHFRSKELNIRSAFPVGEVGKSQKDAWNKPERVYLDKPRSKDDDQTIGDVVLNTYTTPIDFAITNDFLGSLSEQESDILNDLSAGYTKKEIMKRQQISNSLLKSFRTTLASKAVAYLV
jgi:hypothetical protein